MPGKKSTVPTFEVKSILQNLEFLLTRLKDLEATWLEIRNKIPPIELLSYKKSKCDQSDDFYNSAVALFDIIRFLQYGVKDNAGCAQYYWSSEEKFCKISTNGAASAASGAECISEVVGNPKASPAFFTSDNPRSSPIPVKEPALVRLAFR